MVRLSSVIPEQKKKLDQDAMSRSISTLYPRSSYCPVLRRGRRQKEGGPPNSGPFSEFHFPSTETQRRGLGCGEVQAHLALEYHYVCPSGAMYLIHHCVCAAQGMSLEYHYVRPSVAMSPVFHCVCTAQGMSLEYHYVRPSVAMSPVFHCVCAAQGMSSQVSPRLCVVAEKPCTKRRVLPQHMTQNNPKERHPRHMESSPRHIDDDHHKMSHGLDVQMSHDRGPWTVNCKCAVVLIQCLHSIPHLRTRLNCEYQNDLHPTLWKS